MPTGIYTSYAGAVASQADVEVIANNIANVSTSGFRRNITHFDTVLGATMPFARAAAGHIDLSAGVHRLTGNPLNVAIDGPGFFVVEDASGVELLTRRGDFRLDATGRIVLPDGTPVLGSGGALSVPPDAVVEFLPNGTLTANGQLAGRIRIVEVADPAGLSKVAGSLLRAGEGTTVEDVARPRIAPGFIEGSNVNLAAEMVALLQAQRSFEAAMKSLGINDELTQRLIQSQQ